MINWTKSITLSFLSFIVLFVFVFLWVAWGMSQGVCSSEILNTHYSYSKTLKIKTVDFGCGATTPTSYRIYVFKKNERLKADREGKILNKGLCYSLSRPEFEIEWINENYFDILEKKTLNVLNCKINFTENNRLGCHCSTNQKRLDRH